MMEEAEYRKKIQSTFDAIEKAFSDVDPDQAECEQQLGALTLLFPDGSRCILSAQPSVRQLWLALASRGTAYHFNWDESQRVWKDDKGRGIELLSLLEDLLKKETGLSLKLA